MPYLGEKKSTRNSAAQDIPIDWPQISSNEQFEDEYDDFSNPYASIDGKNIIFEAISETTIDNTKPLKVIMLKGEKGDTGTPGSAGDYETLINKPKINSTVLIGDKTLEELGAQYLQKLTNSEIEALLT